MTDTGKLFLRRMAVLTALLEGHDPKEVGKALGMDAKQVSNTLRGLAKMGVLDAERVSPTEGSPAYVKFKNEYRVATRTLAVLRVTK